VALGLCGGMIFTFYRAQVRAGTGLQASASEFRDGARSGLALGFGLQSQSSGMRRGLGPGQFVLPAFAQQQFSRRFFFGPMGVSSLALSTGRPSALVTSCFLVAGIARIVK